MDKWFQPMRRQVVGRQFPEMGERSYGGEALCMQEGREQLCAWAEGLHGCRELEGGCMVFGGHGRGSAWCMEGLRSGVRGLREEQEAEVHGGGSWDGTVFTVSLRLIHFQNKVLGYKLYWSCCLAKPPRSCPLQRLGSMMGSLVTQVLWFGFIQDLAGMIKRACLLKQDIQTCEMDDCLPSVMSASVYMICRSYPINHLL